MSTPDRPEAELVAEQVNQHPTGPTDPEEEAILRHLYGEPDAEGIYRGEPRS
jgi:hypothetical protein